MRRWGRAGWLVLAAGLALWVRPVQSAESTLTQMREAHARVRDLAMAVQRAEVREAELRRMKRSAATALEFSRIKVYFMAPDRLRMEGRRGLVPLTVVENGNIQVIRFGLGIRSRKDLSKTLRRKQGGLEFGLLSAQVWQDYTVTPVGNEEVDGRPALLLQLRVRGERPGSSFQRLWVDRENFRVLRRDRLDGDGNLKSRQLFRQPYRSPAGTWLSRRIEVYNQHGRFVGALHLADIEVNQGLAESLFRT